MAAGLSQAPQKEHLPGRKFGPGDPVIFKLCRFFVKAIGGSQTTAITRTCDRIDVYMCGIAGLVHIRGARLSAARPLIANNNLVEIFRSGKDRPDKPCTYCNRCLVNVVENPLGCYEESRYPSRDAMIAEIMSVFNPPPFV